MKSLWSALVYNLLNGNNGSDASYVLTEEDKEQIAAKIMDGVELYELTEADKEEITAAVLKSIPTPEGSSDTELEYINTVTATGDTKVIVCDRDWEGNEFSLKKFVMFIRTNPSPSSTSQGTTLYSCFTLDPEEDLATNASNYKSSLMSSGVSQSDVKHLGCTITIDGISEDEVTGVRTVVFHGEPSLSACVQTNVPANANGICKIGIYLISTTCIMGEGSSIRIYGIRA